MRSLPRAVWLSCAWLPVLAAVSWPSVAQPIGAVATTDGPPVPTPPAVVARDDQGRVTLRATRLDEALALDGRLDEPIYARVPYAGDFIQQEPTEGAPATEQTHVWVFFDRRNVYVTVRCFDEAPDTILANELRRDHGNIYSNDNVTVVLDTFHDRRNAFLFQTNALGALRDGQVTGERNHNVDWSTVWDVKTGRFPNGWVVEMAIPFKSIRYRPGTEQVWGFNVARVIRRKNEFQYLTPIPASYGVRGIFKLSSAATLIGIEPPDGSRNLEIKPYALASLTTNLGATPVFANHLGGDVGIDAKYGLTRGLTADFTYNTDFAQVEADEQQVNLTRFSLFFPEKREFFLEGQGIFEFGGVGRRRSASVQDDADVPILFFSRQIGLSEGQAVPIVAGARLTGRIGPYSIGALDIGTRDSSTGEAAATNFSVVRLKRDVLRRSTVGILGTLRSPSVDGIGNNVVGGVDASLAFFQDLAINAYYAKSSTNGRAGDATSYRAQLDYQADRYGVQVEHLLVGDGFRPEIGFLRREAFRRNFVEARFSPRPARVPAIRKLIYQGSLDYITGTGGALETRAATLTFQSEMQNGDLWTVDHVRSFESLDEDFAIATDVTIPPGAYTFQDVGLSYRLGPQRPLTGTISVRRGSFFDGHRSEAGLSGRWGISPRLSIEPRISGSWVDLPSGRFTAALLGGRANVTFGPRMQLSTLAQYNSGSHALSVNIRARWEYQPGSDLFVVYSEGRDTFGRGSTQLRNRSVAVKLTRLIRY